MSYDWDLRPGNMLPLRLGKYIQGGPGFEPHAVGHLKMRLGEGGSW